MTVRIYVKTVLLCALVSLALGGLLLHLRIHPVSQNPSNLVAPLAGILGVVAVPLLFACKSLVEYGYVLNGMLVIVGTITMLHFSLAHWPVPTTFETVILKTLLADIALLWANFFVGKALFDLEFFGYDSRREKKGKTWRYPNLGWWLVHLVALSAVYYVGHGLWR
ncbi:MAG TPA: hypothetical protein VMU60_12425 [Syntrophobacteria bacterium]|nr:hypothetical protein [Syntrophobacteria bacterium]